MNSTGASWSWGISASAKIASYSGRLRNWRVKTENCKTERFSCCSRSSSKGRPRMPAGSKNPRRNTKPSPTVTTPIAQSLTESCKESRAANNRHYGLVDDFEAHLAGGAGDDAEAG